MRSPSGPTPSNSGVLLCAKETPNPKETRPHAMQDDESVVVILGDSGVGKTSLMTAWLNAQQTAGVELPKVAEPAQVQGTIAAA